MGFCQWAEMGPKVGFGVQKWVKSGSKPTFDPTLNTFRDFRENPLFSQSKGVGNCFLKRALKQSRPSVNLQNHLFYRVFSGMPPKFERVKSSPPEFGGYGSSGQPHYNYFRITVRVKIITGSLSSGTVWQTVFPLLV